MRAGEKLVQELLEHPDPAFFALRVGQATDEELAEGMCGGKGVDLVREIFNRMPNYLDRERAADVSGVVHWRVGDPPDWLAEYEVMLKWGECSVGETLDGEPTVSFEIEPVALLKLVAGTATGMDLMLTRRLVVRGDVSFAMLTERLFTIGEEQPEEGK